MFVVDNRGGVPAEHRIAVAIQAPARDIQNPIFNNARARIKRSLHVEIEIQATVRNFNQQSDVLRLRIARNEVRAFAIQHDEIRLRLVRRIVGGALRQ